MYLLGGKIRNLFISTILLLLFLASVAAQVDYNAQIQPIFNSNCTQCHGTSGGLNLSSYSDLMSNDVIVPGDH